MSNKIIRSFMTVVLLSISSCLYSMDNTQKPTIEIATIESSFDEKLKSLLVNKYMTLVATRDACHRLSVRNYTLTPLKDLKRTLEDDFNEAMKNSSAPYSIGFEAHKTLIKGLADRTNDLEIKIRNTQNSINNRLGKEVDPNNKESLKSLKEKLSSVQEMLAEYSSNNFSLAECKRKRSIGYTNSFYQGTAFGICLACFVLLFCKKC